MQWLSDHLATILICALLIAVVALILRNLIRARKSGKSSCGGDCAHCGGSCGGSSRPASEKTVTLTLHIDGMQCGMCEAHLCDTVRRHFPVRSVKASYKTGTVLLRAERDIPDSDLHAAIDGTGYTLLSVTRQ